MNLIKLLFFPHERHGLLRDYHPTEPVDGRPADVYAHKSWTVRWFSRQGSYSYDTQPEMEIFPLKVDAETFANQLKAAYKLLKHTSGTRVTVEENK